MKRTNMVKLVLLCLVLYVSFIVAVSWQAFTTRTPASYLDEQYITPIVMFMRTGELGYVRQSSLRVAYDLEFRINKNAKVSSTKVYSQDVRIMRVENGVCVDPRTLSNTFTPTVYIRHDQTLRAMVCNMNLFGRLIN